MRIWPLSWNSILYCTVVVSILLAPFYAHSQNSGPFESLSGQWSGTGNVQLSNGARETIRCRAVYDVLEDGRNVQLDLRCASDSYNFNLQSSAKSNSGDVSGSWTEVTRNAAGTLSGRVRNGEIQVLAKGPTFSAELKVITQADQQSITIKTRNEQAAVTGASITLRKG